MLMHVFCVLLYGKKYAVDQMTTHHSQQERYQSSRQALSCRFRSPLGRFLRCPFTEQPPVSSMPVQTCNQGAIQIKDDRVIRYSRTMRMRLSLPALFSEAVRWSFSSDHHCLPCKWQRSMRRNKCRVNHSSFVSFRMIRCFSLSSLSQSTPCRSHRALGLIN